MAEKPDSKVDELLKVVSSYDTEFKKWEARNTRILKKYRDDNRSGSSSANESAKFNILWANVQTLSPAVYARMPKADVSRRFADNDPVGRVASLLIERALDYEIEHYTDFRSCMKLCVEDRFLGGRGVGWVRYDPHLKAQEPLPDGVEITNNIEGEGPQDRTAADNEVAEEIDYECSPTDYVHWKDFGHSSARIWEEVTKVWRWVYMTAPALDARFGKGTSKKVPMDSGPEPLNKYVVQTANDRAKICEMWDKETGTVYWFSKGYNKIIEELPDPLGLEGFFPCPKPLYATTTSDNLVPVPDFVLYQDQANDLDILADRIDGLIKALRVRGVYDSSQKGLQRLLTEGDNNTLVPVDTWAAFAEKGGLKGCIDLLPLDTLAAALLQCYQAEADIKATIYEITGISDIVRGQSKASETATAQQIKGQYVGLRLKSMQENVALFASGLIRLMAQIICTKYQTKTILDYAAAEQMNDADKQLIPQALELIKNEPLRSFRIEVAADSLVQIDEAQNKQDALDFVNSFSNYMREAVPAGQQVPEMVPAIVGIAKFMVTKFKAARSIEGMLDVALEQLKAKAKQAAANPQPSPEEKKAQAEAQVEAQHNQFQAQADAQHAQFQAQAQAQVAMITEKAEAQKMAMEQRHEAQMTAMEQRFEAWEAKLKSETAIEVANISAQSSLDVAETSAQAALAREYAGNSTENTETAP